MNAFERYAAVLRGGVPDILPRIPIVMQFAAEYIGSDYAAFASEYAVLVEANCRCARDFGFEQLSAISDPYRETHGFGGLVTYVRDGVPRCTTVLAESKDLSLLLRPDPRSSARMLDRLRAIEEYRRRHGRAYSVMGWVEGPAAEAADLRGVSNFLMDMLDDEEFAARLMDRCLAVGIEFARAQIAAGADTIGIGDAVASQLSPAVYGSLVQPREKALVAAIHDAGGYVRLHICGNITHLLPGIADLGVDILDIDHMVDPVRVRRAVGGVVLCGNINPVDAVLRGTPAAIGAYVREIYRSAGNPFMVSAGCEIPSGTPVENLQALCEPVAYATGTVGE